MTSLILALVLAASAVATSAQAQPKPDPAWPCVQRRVPTIAAGAVWAGPDSVTAGEWGKDFEAAALAQKLASRRTPLDEVDALIEEFAKKAGADKAQRLTRVFAGVLELVNTERNRILEGIERYAKGQNALAERLRREADTVSAAADRPGVEVPREVREVQSQFVWDKRIFEERRQALTYVCETPALLERRVYDIAQKLQQHL